MEKENFLHVDNRSKHSHIRNTEVIKVIRTISFFGNGTEENPDRFIYQYWDLNGTLLATFDPINSNLEKVSSKSLVKSVGIDIKSY